MKVGSVIYLDHQASTPASRFVVECMTPHFGNAFANPHSNSHVLGWAAARSVDESAATVAAWLGVDQDEIIFTSGATEANNLALLGLARRESRGERRRILCSAIEHKSVLAACRAVRDSLGFDLDVVPVDGHGFIILEDLQDLLRDDVLFISVGAVNSEIGTVQDIAQISKAAAEVGAIFHCDAAQAPCALNPAHVAQRADLMSLSAHKMYGPKGIGVLVARRGIQDHLEPLIYGGEQQRGLRPGTIPTPLCVGMAAATTALLGDSAQQEWNRIGALRDRFVNAIRSLEWQIELNGSAKSRHPGNANIQFKGFSAEDILGVLQPTIAASTGSACSSGLPEPSHVLRAIGLNDDQALASIRFGFGRATTEADVDEAVMHIERALRTLAANGLRRAG